MMVVSSIRVIFGTSLRGYDQRAIFDLTKHASEIQLNTAFTTYDIWDADSGKWRLWEMSVGETSNRWNVNVQL